MRALHLADFITELNGACGVLSVLSSMRFCLDGDPKNLWFALAFLPFGLFFDFLDGKVARWRGKSSMMGQELDSLADLVRFNERKRDIGERTATTVEYGCGRRPKSLSSLRLPSILSFSFFFRIRLRS